MRAVGDLVADRVPVTFEFSPTLPSCGILRWSQFLILPKVSSSACLIPHLRLLTNVPADQSFMDQIMALHDLSNAFHRAVSQGIS